MGGHAGRPNPRRDSPAIEWRGGDYGAIEKQLLLVHHGLRRLAKRHIWRLTLTPARESVPLLTGRAETLPDEAHGA